MELENALGNDAYESVRGVGALVTAPLWLGPEHRPVAKVAMLLLGNDRAEVFALDHRIRERFEQ